MKNYRVTVNGNNYDVAVEEVFGVDFSNGSAPAAPQAAQSPAPAAQAAPAPAPAGGGSPIEAPMPGTILDIKVKVGDTVAENQTVAVLEAMKMENDISTPFAGTVTSIASSKGATVESGDTILLIAKS